MSLFVAFTFSLSAANSLCVCVALQSLQGTLDMLNSFREVRLQSLRVHGELCAWTLPPLFFFLNNASCDVSSFALCLCPLPPFPLFISFVFFSCMMFLCDYHSSWNQARHFLKVDVERNRVGNLGEWLGFVLSNTLLLNPSFSFPGAHHPLLSALRLPRFSAMTSRLQGSRV